MAGDPEEIVLSRRPAAREYPHAKATRRSRGLGFVGRASILWLAACSVLGLLCLWCGSDAGHGPAVANTQLAASKAAAEYRTCGIEDLRKGDMVVAWDPVTGQLGRHEVSNTFARTSDHLRIVEFAADGDGQTQTLQTTDEHPFWSVRAGDFVAAGDLRIGDRFISPADEFSTLIATHREQHPEGMPVYNFEVSGVHNYYVRAHGLRAPPVRVHNANSLGCASIKGKTEGHHSDPIFMEGKKNQKLTQLPRSTHRGAGQSLHNDLSTFLRGKTNGFGRHMRPQRGNSGKAIRSHFSREERLHA